MITIFNRKELKTTFSVKTQAKIKDILNASHIDYAIKAVNRKSPSPFAAGSRARTGTYGEKLESEYEYIIYVKKEDYEKARFVTKNL